jgi:hypothetical protein
MNNILLMCLPMCSDEHTWERAKQVHQACPQALLPVLPHLVSELQVEAQDRRLQAIDLLVSAFAGSDSSMDVDYSDLFEELLRRCCDKQVSGMLV